MGRKEGAAVRGDLRSAANRSVMALRHGKGDAMSEQKLGLGDPGYEFPKEVHTLLALANTTNITVSGMADTKASILMGASFVVFSMSISDIAEGKASMPLLVLTMFSFVATVFGVLTVRPGKMVAKPIPIEKANLLFFGSYSNAPREPTTPGRRPPGLSARPASIAHTTGHGAEPPERARSC